MRVAVVVGAGTRTRFGQREHDVRDGGLRLSSRTALRVVTFRRERARARDLMTLTGPGVQRRRGRPLCIQRTWPRAYTASELGGARLLTEASGGGNVIVDAFERFVEADRRQVLCEETFLGSRSDEGRKWA